LRPIAVIAIGGNSLSRAGEPRTLAEQLRNARVTCDGVAEVLAMGWRVVLTHGNGPQVGDALLRAERARAELPELTLDGCGAETQGLIGYLLQQSLDNALAARGMARTVASIVTQVVVDPADPAFREPTKPIGPFYDEEEAGRRIRDLGWEMQEDSGRGWRRVVASPTPVEVVELGAIRACLAAGAVVIAGGGGGIPVVRRDGALEGVEAVIDKDRTSALLARCLSAELLMFSTGVERVAWHYGAADERPLDRLSWSQAMQYLRQGEFPAGSMGPKIEGALEFLREGGHRAIVTSPERLAEAVRGRAGTVILPPRRPGQARTEAA
jgi:carbamate kinase